MKLKNPFTQSTRLLFLYEYACMNCERSDQGLELHHLHGRISNSPLNACPLCLNCHAIGKRDNDFRQLMHNKILKLLEKLEYNLTKEDNEFYAKYY